MFLTAQDFNVFPYRIPNIDTDETFQPTVNKLESDSLLSLLGYSLYNDFIEGLNGLPAAYNPTVVYANGITVTYGVSVWQSLQDDNEGNTPEEGAFWHKVEDNRWLLLKLGDSYMYCGKKYFWKGVVDLLTPYVFSEWLTYNSTFYTGAGVVVPTNENAENIAPARMIADSWNSYARIAGNCHQMKNTLYGYLINKNEDQGTFDDTFDETFTSFASYLNFVFENPGRKNTFNI